MNLKTIPLLVGFLAAACTVPAGRGAAVDPIAAESTVQAAGLQATVSAVTWSATATASANQAATEVAGRQQAAAVRATEAAAAAIVAVATRDAWTVAGMQATATVVAARETEAAGVRQAERALQAEREPYWFWGVFGVVMLTSLVTALSLSHAVYRRMVAVAVKAEAEARAVRLRASAEALRMRREADRQAIMTQRINNTLVVVRDGQITDRAEIPPAIDVRALPPGGSRPLGGYQPPETGAGKISAFLQAARQVVGGDADWLPSAAQMGISGQTWTEAVRCLKNVGAVITTTGRPAAGGHRTLLHGYASLDSLIHAVGEGLVPDDIASIRIPSEPETKQTAVVE